MIEKIIHDQTAEIIDENHTKLIENTEKSEDKDPDLEKQENDQTEKKNEDRQVASSFGQQSSPGKTVKAVSDPNAKKQDKTRKASRGTSVDEEEGGGGNKESSAGQSDDPNSRQIKDGNGKVVDLPEKVDSVVAASSASGIVQMLGGRNILAGTSAGFAQDEMAMSVFGSEVAADVAQLWDGDGSTPMPSDSFQALLSMKPDVCIGVSGETNFSDAQIKKLKEKKIAYVTLPRLNTDSNIKDAVTICGKMIGNRSSEEGGINAKSLAAKYVEYSNDLISRVSSRTGVFTWDSLDFNNDVAINGEKHIRGASSTGLYTLYISGWEAGVYTRKDGNEVQYEDATGIAAAPQGYSNSPLSYYMSVAGVCNNGARMRKTASSIYAAIPFALNVANNSITGSSLPLYPTSNENFARAWDNSTIDVGLGEPGFPAIVVDSANTMNAILSSPSWLSYGRQTSGRKTDYGPIGANGDIITSYIRNNYEIYINPAGVYSWTTGSAESVLETIWTAYRFSGAFSKGEVKSEIRKFYSTFYRYDLTDSQVEYILQGR